MYVCKFFIVVWEIYYKMKKIGEKKFFLNEWFYRILYLELGKCLKNEEELLLVCGDWKLVNGYIIGYCFFLVWEVENLRYVCCFFKKKIVFIYFLIYYVVGVLMIWVSLSIIKICFFCLMLLLNFYICLF